MASDESTSGKRVRRTAKRAGVLLAVLMVLMLSAWVLRWPLFGGLIRGKLVLYVEKTLKSDVELGEMSGSLVGSLVLNDLSLVPSEGSPLPGRVKAGKITIRYFPWGVLRHVHVEKLDISTAGRPDAGRTSRGRMLGDLLAALEEPPPLPGMTVQGLSVRTSGTVMEFPGVRLSRLGEGYSATITGGGYSGGGEGAATIRAGLLFGFPDGPLRLEVSGPEGKGSLGLVLTVGRRNPTGVRSLSGSALGADVSLSLQGSIEPEEAGGPPSFLSAELGAAVSGLGSAFEAAGIRGGGGGSVAVSASVKMQLEDLLCRGAVKFSIPGGAAISLEDPQFAFLRKVAVDKASAAVDFKGVPGRPFAEWELTNAVVSAQDAAFGGLNVDKLELSGNLEDGRLEVTGALLETAKDRIELSASVGLRPLEGRAGFQAGIRQLRPYLHVAGMKGMEFGPLDLRGEAVFSDGGFELNASAKSRNGAVRLPGGGPQVEWEDLSADVSYDGRRLSISDGRLTGGPGGADFLARAELETGGELTAWRLVSAELTSGKDFLRAAGDIESASGLQLDVSAGVTIPAPWLPETQLGGGEFSGRLSYAGSVGVKGPEVSTKGRISFEDLKAGGTSFQEARAGLAFSRTEAQQGKPASMQVGLEGLVLRCRSLGLDVRADAMLETGKRGPLLVILPERVELLGDGVILPERMALAPAGGPDSTVRLQPFYARWRGAEVTASGEFGKAGFDGEAALSIPDIRAVQKGFGAEPAVSGSIDLTLSFSGTPEEGFTEMRIEGNGLAVQDAPLGGVKMDGRVEWPGENSTFFCRLQAGLQGGIVAGSLRAGVPMGAIGPDAPVLLDTDLSAKGVVRYLPVDEKLREDLEGFWDGIDLELKVAGTAGRPLGRGVIGFRRNQGNDEAEGAAFRYEDGVLRFLPAVVTTPYGKVDIQGSLPLELTLAPELRIRAGEEEPDLRVELTSERPERLAGLLPEWVRKLRPEGRLQALLRMGKDETGLVPEVGFTFSNAVLTPDEPVPVLDDVEIRGVFSRGRVKVDGFSALMGHGRIEGSGWFDPSGKKDMEFSVRGNNVLLVGSGGYPVRVRADLDVRLSGRPGDVLLEGMVKIPLALYYREFTLGGGPPQDIDEIIATVGVELPAGAGGGVVVPGLAGLEWMNLDLDVETTGEMRISNSLAGAMVKGDLKVRGTGAAPSVSGRVRASSGELRAFPGIFFPILDFELEIPEAEGAEPTVSFSSATVAGLTRIFIRVSGPLASPGVLFFSDPPLPQEEIIGLLAFGRTTGPAGDPGEALLGQAGRLARGFFADRFPRAEPERGFWSRLNFAFGVDTVRTASLMPLQDGPVSDGNLLLKTEFVLNEWLSVVTENDEEGDMGGDLRLSFRWPRRNRSEEGTGGFSEERPSSVPAGLSYRVEGNHSIRLRRIRRVVDSQAALAGGGGWTEAHLADAAYRIGRLYGELGYYKAEVTTRLDGETAVFEIDEGPRIILGHVTFTGNNSITGGRLREALIDEMPGSFDAPFSRRLLQAQIDSIAGLYRSEGFLDVEVEEPELKYVEKKRAMDIVFGITEGPLYHVGKVVFEGAPEDDLERIASEYRGARLKEAVPDLIAGRVCAFYKEQGRPGSRCSASVNLDRERAEGVVSIKVHKGPRVRIGRIEVRGARKLRKGYVPRIMRLGPGDLFVSSRVRRAEKSLVDTGLFRSVNVIPRYRDEDEERGGARVADLVVKLEEVPHIELTASGGYATDEGFRAGLDLSTRNAFGHGEVCRAGGKINEEGFEVSGEALFPLFGFRSIRLGLRGLVESRDKPGYDLDYASVSSMLGWDISSNDQIRVGLRYDSVRTLNIAAGVPPGDLTHFRNLIPVLVFRRDKRDSRLDPHRGYVASGAFEFASTDFGSDISYTRFSTFSSVYFPLERRMTLAIGLRGALIKPQEDTVAIPVALRLFSGGIGSVRGIEEDRLGPDAGGVPIGGEVLIALQTELRFRIWRDLYGAVFYDRGNVYEEAAGFRFGDMRHGAGGGLRYRTPVGYIVLEAGFNLDPQPDEPGHVLYLVFGLPF